MIVCQQCTGVPGVNPLGFRYLYQWGDDLVCRACLIASAKPSPASTPATTPAPAHCTTRQTDAMHYMAAEQARLTRQADADCAAIKGELVKGWQTVADLAESTRVKPPRIRAMIARMERMGVVINRKPIHNSAALLYRLDSPPPGGYAA